MTNRAQILAAGWAAGYGTLALGWAITGRGFPFGPADERGDLSALRALEPSAGAPIFAVVLLLAAVALIFTRGSAAPRGPVRYAVLTYLWLVTAALLAVVPDARLLTIAGYAPMLIIGLPFGWPPDVDYSTVFTWTVANQAIAAIGGVLIARAALTWQRRTRGACETCGRDGTRGGWTSPSSAARWGRIAVWIAAAIPAMYAVVRLAWAAGIPLGISGEFLEEMQREGITVAAAGLGGFALAGAILTLGLTQRWGEVFPRWMIGLSGRRVPIRLATIPASIVAVLVASASISLYTGEGSEDLLSNGLATAPALLWPLWSAALAAATYAYHLRRRPRCEQCHRPAPLTVVRDTKEQAPAGLVRESGARAY
ncbi:hypothetical protein AB0M02_13445 [Actinoplanes sp. NPDC051861]|uniref:hypothetical protein n=1 Tax=Actinoplanes sp. NPDC051861 TaxID=3155170 RepID=UPI00344753C5